VARNDLKVHALLAPVLEGMGYEFVGVEYHPNGRHSVLRVYIDAEAGITVDDCARVSHQVSGVLDVEDPIPGQYALEVSSPGLDRPLFEAAHYERFVGYKAKVRLVAPLPERAGRKFTGEIRRMDGDAVVLETEGTEYRVPLDQIESARLVAEL